MTTGRLASLLAGRDPAEAYAIAVGTCAPPPDPIASLFGTRPDARGMRGGPRPIVGRPSVRGSDVWRHGIAVVVPGDAMYPSQLLDDPRRPAVLFVRGDLGVLDARRVGIVGTRNATQRGRETAAQFGYELSAAGVAVVSGLAKGIDGAAHRGALAVDGPRPVARRRQRSRRAVPEAAHRRCGTRCAERGALISEWPPGTTPDAFRFPLRNRILAGLVEVLVVVESRERGGSLITAREAAERGVEVFAVPGAVQSRGVDRHEPVCSATASHRRPSVDDVLMALGLDQRRAGRARFDPRPTSAGG